MSYEREFLVALLLTVLIEIPVLFVSMSFCSGERFRELSKVRIAVTGVFASFCTLPYLWFVLGTFLRADRFLVYGELIVTGVEAFILGFFLDLTPGRSLLISVLCNATSYFVGGYLIRHLV